MTTSTLTTQSHALPSANLAARLMTVQEISGIEADILSELSDFIANAPDEALFRANPYRYASHMGLADRRALDLFLYATHVGIFDINFGVLCPGCGAFITSPGGLRTLTAHSFCHLCRTDVNVSVDDGVEVAFTIAPAVRRIRFHSHDTLELERDWQTLLFTKNRIPAPEFLDNVDLLNIRLGQLRDGETVNMDLTLEAGGYLISIPRHHTSTHFEISGDSAESLLTFDVFDGRIVPENPTAAPGNVHITIRNRTGHDILYGVLRDPKRIFPMLPDGDMSGMAHYFQWLPYVTGKQVAMSQVFRELFRSESIPSDLGLEFKSVTFLFSDLKGSTALYDRIGDLQAYQLVREHFRLLRDIIAELGGAVVKTMGDAVMATFPHPLPALEAAILMNREIGKLGAEEGLILKIGLHSGPCIAVESNERLDYFGQSVNIAARVGSVAGPGEIVITNSVYECPGASEALRSAALVAAQERTTLRGVGQETTFYRLS